MKLGRNDLCYCGSGKKYKKCCINKKIDEEFDSDMLTRAFIRLKEQASKSKEHIQRYYKLRRIHSEVLDSMMSYYDDGKYDFAKQLDNACDSILEELKGDLLKVKFKFELENEDEFRLFNDLICYKNHKDIVSITEEYLEKNKFRNKENIKMLKAMNNSYVGLFKIIDIDTIDSYVELEDVFTKRRFKIIDISLSLTTHVKDCYIYNRIITYDDISFGTGINISFNKNDKNLIKYIENYDENLSDLIKTLTLFEISKKTGIRAVVNSIK